jgi:YfiH family protein
MVFDRVAGLTLLQFPHLVGINGLQHAVTTRDGGVSRSPQRGLNLSRAGDDDPMMVDENRRRLQRAMAPGQLIFIRQVHGATVLPLDAPLDTEGWPVVGTADAFVTDRPGRLLTILVADCQAVLLYDPRQRVVANVHSGWRGSIANIIGAAVDVMRRHFGCCPGDILAGVGPSLGPCCAEFKNYRHEIPSVLWNYRVGTDHFDFWALSRDQLMATGLASENIRLGRICTRCHPELFFSYRAGHKTGRCAGVIGLISAKPASSGCS